jgi:nicotinate-nucleotide adenylyltransferase
VKLGVMGGTFDPIHLGHLRAAELAREALQLDRILFVPTGVPPHRDPPCSSAFDRYAMVCLATHAHPSFAVSDVELVGPGPHFTVDTLARLARTHEGATFHLILGSDAFREIETWRDHERLRAICRLAVVARPGSTDALPLPGADCWATGIPGDSLPISATLVRRLVAEGRSVRYLVPQSVADHITKRGLYR